MEMTIMHDTQVAVVDMSIEMALTDLNCQLPCAGQF